MTFLDDLGSTEPRCPDCGVVMRSEEGGWTCPACRRFEPVEQGPLPAELRGPGIHGG
ncbi:hypothetical protein ACWIBQ_01690 [Microbacterium keratanolyticum]